MSTPDFAEHRFNTRGMPVAEHIEIVSGQCQVKIGLQTEMRLYHAGESFDVPANSRFSMMASEVVDYICHLEK